jgi:hypothetical protein
MAHGVQRGRKRVGEQKAGNDPLEFAPADGTMQSHASLSRKNGIHADVKPVQTLNGT